MKKIFICFVVLLLTGCTINYNLEVGDKTITENIDGTILKNEFDLPSDENGDLLFYSLLYDEQPSLVDGTDLYQKTIDDLDSVIKFNYKYSYQGNFDKSRILNECFENAAFEETDKYYYFSATGSFNCLFSDDIDINITSNFAAIKSNANKVNGNTHTWILNDGNDVDILLVLSKNILYKENEKKPIFSTFQIIGFSALIILIILLLILYKKKYKNDSNY